MLKLRPAVAADQQAITEMIAAAELNPSGLEWPRFLVVADGGEVVGIGQVKGHFDGTRELASLAVRPAYQGRGIGHALMIALLARRVGLVAGAQRRSRGRTNEVSSAASQSSPAHGPSTASVANPPVGNTGAPPANRSANCEMPALWPIRSTARASGSTLRTTPSSSAVPAS